MAVFAFFSFPAASMISCPHPPAPLPVGKGAFRFHMQGASPLASPRPSRKRHGLHLRCGCPAGGLPGRSPARPALNFIGCPHPPAPLPVGKGAFSFHMQGASPLASPRPSRKRHGLHLRCGCPAVVCPAGRRVALSLALFPAPIPPPPFPLRGRGSPKVYFAGGFAPGTPALNRLRHLQTLPYRCPAGVPRRHHSQGISFFRFCGEP